MRSEYVEPNCEKTIDEQSVAIQTAWKTVSRFSEPKASLHGAFFVCPRRPCGSQRRAMKPKVAVVRASPAKSQKSE